MNQVKELANLKSELQKLITGKNIEPEVGEHIVLDYHRLASIVNAERILGNKIVMTIGSFDIFHIGHGRYLSKAKGLGSRLVVGIDSDATMARYKGEERPIIPAIERLELLASQKPVDYVTIIDDVDKDGRWYYGLLRMLKPDIFVAVEDSYSEEQKNEIREFCSELVVFPRQAENTSSTMIIQKLIKANPELLRKIAAASRTSRNSGSKSR